MYVDADTQKALDVAASSDKVSEQIIQILHDNKIPILFFDMVFTKVKKKVEQNTIPYNPNFSFINDKATSLTNDKTISP